MKIPRYTSLVCLISVMFGMGESYCVNMTAQIERLMNEKQEKISKLEECDGKRKGFMIAGISTLGLTAVGVGGNIALASKSNKLSDQIEEKNLELEKQQSRLIDINAQISQKQKDNARAECEKLKDKEWKNGQCVDKETVKPEVPEVPVIPGGGHDYSGYKLGCDRTQFEFFTSDAGYAEARNRLNGDCITATGHGMEMISGADGKVVLECKDYAKSAKCIGQGGGNEENGGGAGKIYNYALSCENASFKFLTADVAQNQDLINKLNSDCRTATGADMMLAVADIYTVYACTGYKASSVCTGGKEIIELPDRIIGQNCKKEDLAANATAGKYVRDGNLKCLVAKDSKEIVNCQCSISECDNTRGFVLKNGKCELDSLKLTSDCIEKGKKYFANNCLPCLNAWNLMGEDICKADIDKHKGFSKIEKGAVVDMETEFKVFANDGHSAQFICPALCDKKGGISTESCQASGGRGLDSSGKCLCDWTNNGNNQRLRRASNGLCECQTGYERIDPNNLRLGCVSKAFSKDLQDYKKLLEQFDSKFSAIDTAVSTIKRSMESIEKSQDLKEAKKNNYKTSLETSFNTVKTRVSEATNLYNQAVSKYNGLSSEDKAKADKDRTLKDKSGLDAFKREIDSYLKTAEGYVQRGQVAYEKLETQEENKNSGFGYNLVPEAEKCINSHGQWNGQKCSCEKSRGLELDYGECYCINQKWEWCEKKNACRPTTDCK